MSDSNPLRVLFAVSECAPWVKTGGLGDVAGALTRELRREGVDVRIVMPAYRSVLAHARGMPSIATLPHSTALPEAAIVEAVLPGGVPALLVDCPGLYDRAGGPYQDEHGRDFVDNAARFAQLSRAAATLATAASPLAWHPQILHCNDWQTAPAAALVRHASGSRAKTLLTIHNLAFQGVFGGDLTALVGLPATAFRIEGVEYYGATSFLKAGLVYADHLSTVSPTYAREIQREPLGMGLHGVVAGRRDDLTGILNGIDDAAWDPSRDPALAERYDANALERKAGNKSALQHALGLDPRPQRLLIGVVSRLTTQKGADLVVGAADVIARLPAQLVVLGAGDHDLEGALVAAAARQPGAVAATIGFDESLAHRIEAGADAFLMPSRFEPCGLNQMYSQRYGTPPIAHATGGLVDSIIDATPRTIAQEIATGFLFEAPTAESLWRALLRAREAFSNPATWRSLQRAGMSRRFGWAHRVGEYLALYRKLLER